MYAAYSAAVIAHNHNHSPTFRARPLNHAFAAWISIFYGFPTYGWIPTHNANHHVFVGAKGDATVLAQRGERDDVWRAATHFFRSSVTQGPLLRAYRHKLWKSSRCAWASVWGQYAVVYGTHVALLALAASRFGLARGALVYACTLGVPAFMALWGIMFTNWVQHVGCDPDSTWNHSRNFTARWMNALVFDNGFHTVHHERPGLHWSRAREAHEQIAQHIDARCNETSLVHYAWKTYVRPQASFLPERSEGQASRLRSLASAAGKARTV